MSDKRYFVDGVLPAINEDQVKDKLKFVGHS